MTLDPRSMKRVALFHSSFFGRGVARIRINFAEVLLERGYLVDVVVANGSGEMRESLPDSVRVFDLKAPRVLAALPGFMRYLKRESPNAIISAEDHVNVIALMARKLVGSKVPISVSSHVLHSHSISHPKSYMDLLLPKFIRLTYPWANLVVGVSDGLGDDLSSVTRLPREMIETIYNPVVSASMLIQAQAPCPHPWLEEPTPTIVAVGRLTKLKMFDRLIEAIAIVRERRLVRLLILGDGDLKKELEVQIALRRLEGAVELTGFRSNPFAFMSRAAMLVLSSEREGLPGVLIQALGVGCPVVATDCDHGPREILDGGRFGPLVPVGDVPALAAAIEGVLDHPLPAEILKERAQLFEANFILDQYRERLGF